MCHHVVGLRTECVLDACKDQSLEAGKVAGLYTESRKSRLSRVRQIVPDPSCFGGVHVENLGTDSRNVDKCKSSLNDPGIVGSSVGAGHSSA